MNRFGLLFGMMSKLSTGSYSTGFGMIGAGMMGFDSILGCSFSSYLGCLFVGSYSAVFLTSLHSTHLAGDIDSTAGVDSCLGGSVLFCSSLTSVFLGFSFFLVLLSLTYLMTNSAGLISIAGLSNFFSFFSLTGSS